ncbi:hypothetical protein HDU83_003124 [Entophlyctis luteolus]|nr:hypothetical protein HDU83_003124 [Entophlyctis luteolus]
MLIAILDSCSKEELDSAEKIERKPKKNLGDTEIFENYTSDGERGAEEKERISELKGLMGISQLPAGTLAAGAEGIKHDVKTIVSFGDSISDTGNTFKLLGVPQPPYWNGRFSNGPVWVEYLSRYLNNATLYDFAYGGAVANITDATADYLNIPDIFAQRKSYDNSSLAKTLDFDTTLFTVFAGGNDIDFEAAEGVFPDAKKIADYVLEFVDDLISDGVKNFLVNTMPPLNDTPAGRAYGAAFSPVLALLTTTYNNEIRAGLKTIATNNPAVTITINDFYGLLVYASSPQGQVAAGYKDVVDPCYNSTSGSVCADPNTYIYWDGVHPTTIGHNYIAQYAYNALFGYSGYTISTTATQAVSPTSAATETTATYEVDTVTAEYVNSVASTTTAGLGYSAPTNLNSGALAVITGAVGGWVMMWASMWM